MRKFFLSLAALLILSYTAYPCFDTYLFLRKGSMVYPYKSVVFELAGEYSFNRVNSPQEDMFFSNGSIYYGMAPNFSIQLSIGSGEKQRDDFKFDTYGIRGVYNVYSSLNNDYTLDLIMEHRGGGDGEKEIEFSVPNIFRFSKLTYVLHPSVNYALKANEFTPGGHTGLFYDFNESGIIGIGAEYASVHSSSYSGHRITKSEVSASLFLGAHIGSNFYIQNEFAKGLANSRDFGFAITTKLAL